MRVVLLSPNARAADAVGRHVAETVACLLDGGAQVRVVVADGNGLAPALRPYKLVAGSAAIDGPGWRAAQAADLVIVQFSQYYPLLDWVPLLADGQRRIIFDYHALTPPRYATGPTRAAILRGQDMLGLAGFADGVICHSGFAERELADAVAVSGERLHRIGYCVDASRPSGSGEASPCGLAICCAARDVVGSSDQEAVSLREPLALGDARVALFVGRLAANKRVPVLIEAIATLRDLDPPMHAVIVGPSGGQFEPERLTCRERAADLGIADRVHYLGEVDEATLSACYANADVFVMPSVHEGFCFPVVEAMSNGAPVVAARAGALPETVADAGLLFAPDDAADLARQMQRVLAPTGEKPLVRRVAVVAPNVDPCAGGAERSLSLMAAVLADSGLDVSVFTTQNAAGVAPLLRVTCHAADPCDAARRRSAAAAIAANPEGAGAEVEATYFQNTARSSALIEAIRGAGPFDAILVGPAVTGLAREVVRAFGESVVLVPCLHDEPLSRTRVVREMFERCGAVWFHSAAEKRLAEEQLGLTHPRSEVIGTWIDVDGSARPECGRMLAGSVRYVVYCGRFAVEKGLPRLFEYARRHTGDVRVVFVGQGDAIIPNEPWAVNLGRLPEADKRDVMAGAMALVQLSPNESLSLVVLEAQALGVPVIVNGENAVLADHARHGGGIMVNSYDEFAAALDRLQHDAGHAAKMGHDGRKYVVEAFGSKSHLTSRLVGSLAMLAEPLVQRMRANGRRRASEFSRDRWRLQWQRIIDCVFDTPSVYQSPVVDVRGDRENQVVSAGGCVRVILEHTGGRPLVPAGPGRTQIVLCCRAADGDTVGDEWTAHLPAVVGAGDCVSIDAVLPLGLEPGTVELEARLRTFSESGSIDEWLGTVCFVRIAENTSDDNAAVKATQPLSRKWKTALERARSVHALPDSYVDVTAGVAARVKRWAKHKLTHNFRVGYVDVLSRQQTRFNREILQVLENMAAAPATDSVLAAEIAALRRELEVLKAARGGDRPLPRRVA